MTEPLLVRPEDLVEWAAAVLTLTGLRDEDARLVADSLVDADARGVSSHGCRLLPLYVTRLQRGDVVLHGQPQVVHDAGALALVDGSLVLGQIAAAFAVDLLVQKAKHSGVAAVAVRETTHFGALGYFTRRAAAAGILAVGVQNGPPMVPAYGSVTPLLGTNPLSWAAPTPDEPVVFDAALTAVAGNRVHQARAAGHSSLPDGWALDAEGRPTTDAAAAADGFLAWAAGHKGFGLAMLIELLSGPLTGSSFGTNHRSASPIRGRGRIDKGACFIGLDPAALLGTGAFEESAHDLREQVRTAQPASGVDRVMAPGDVEHAKHERAIREGVELDVATVSSLAKLGHDIGIAWPGAPWVPIPRDTSTRSIVLQP